MVSEHFSHRNVVVFASFVRGGDVGQVLDDLLGVLCLASTRLTPNMTDVTEKSGKRQINLSICLAAEVGMSE